MDTVSALHAILAHPLPQSALASRGSYGVTDLIPTLRAHPLESGAAALAALILLALVGRLALRRRPKAPPAEIPASPRTGKEAVPATLCSGTTAQEAVGSPPAPVPPRASEPKVAPAPEIPPAGEDAAKPEGYAARLRRGLARTQEAFVGRIDALLRARGAIDEETLEEIEEVLYTADLGVATATRMLEDLRARARAGATPEDCREVLREDLLKILSSDGGGPMAPGPDRPWVVLFVGVNGVGKTTTIGKLGALHAGEGRRVMLAAGDTFRAAAMEQLEIWGERIGAPVIRQASGTDPSAVAFDAVAAAKSRDMDVLLVDTAGRLHTKVNLMEELKKVKRIIARELPGAPQEVLLVLDATTGQNAVSQARQFHEAVGVTGIILTKLDGTARGGIVIAIHEELKLPIRYIGVGENLDDLRPFDARAFVDALFEPAVAQALPRR